MPAEAPPGKVAEESWEEYPLDWTYEADDLGRIRWGLAPSSTDDKWFAYADGDTVFIFRSWTGAPCYKLRLTASGIDRLWIAQGLPHREWHRTYVRWLVEYRLIGRDWPFPEMPFADAPDRCFVCARDLRWEPDDKSWSCAGCGAVFHQCLYCRKPSWRTEPSVRSCVNAECPARGVRWLYCAGCRDFRALEVDPSGVTQCTSLRCYNGFTVSECPACKEWYPTSAGTCVEPRCGRAFRRSGA